MITVEGQGNAEFYTKAAADSTFTEKQTWVDNTLGIESANADAVKNAYSTTSYLTGATTLTNADIALDTKVKSNADAIATKLSGAEAADYTVSGKRGAELAANIATYVG
ncbi:MAG: hypothetical protein MJ212_05235, partial [Alphaproteobacteria bacterium]|nr:hypothetical protein [Alphaproteobacteria bacterium]